jgi:hypothetical protein
VVGDEVLGLAKELSELAHTPVASGQLRQQPPALRVACKLEDRRR